MVMHAYGFVLPLNWVWQPIDKVLLVDSGVDVDISEAWHELCCHASVNGLEDCLASWRFPDSELVHVACLDLQNLTREHERSLHSGGFRMGMRVAPGSMNCLGGKVDYPQQPLAKIPRVMVPSPHVQSLRGPAPLPQPPQPGKPASLPWSDPDSDPAGDVARAYRDAEEYSREHPGGSPAELDERDRFADAVKALAELELPETD